MLTRENIDALETLIGKLDGIYAEMSALAKKSPNDGVNEFKLGLINKAIEASNILLGDKYKPFDDFLLFDKDTVPSNSDVIFMIKQYMNAMEKYRSDHIHNDSFGVWNYHIKEGGTVQTSPPSKLGK